MNRPAPAQIRAARALLDWSMMDLAKAAWISVAAVHRYESSRHQTGSSDAITLMQDALETEGVLFLADEGNGPGVRYKQR